MALFKDKPVDPSTGRVTHNQSQITSSRQSTLDPASMTAEERIRYDKSQELLRRTEELVRSDEAIDNTAQSNFAADGSFITPSSLSDIEEEYVPIEQIVQRVNVEPRILNTTINADRPDDYNLIDISTDTLQVPGETVEVPTSINDTNNALLNKLNTTIGDIMNGQMTNIPDTGNINIPNLENAYGQQKPEIDNATVQQDDTTENKQDLEQEFATTKLNHAISDISKPANQKKLPSPTLASGMDEHITSVSDNGNITSNTIQSQFNIPTDDIETSDTEETETDPINPDRLIIPVATRDELEKHLQALIIKYKDDEEGFNRELSNPDSFLSQIVIATNMLNANQRFEQKAINDISADSLLKEIPEFKSHTTSTFSQKSIPTDKYVSGEQARMFVASKVRGMKRVPLPNSGFHIWIRPLNNFELNEFVNTLYSETTTFGKIFGVHYYLFSDFLAKRFIMDRLGSIVTGSSLVGWKQKNVLTSNIKLPDYKVIIWAIVTLMYKEGVTFTKVCGNCGGTEEVVLNLNNLYFCNYDVLTKNDSQMIMAKNTSVTPEILKQYHESLVFDVSDTIKLGDWIFKLKIPSLEEYMVFADMFYASLMKYCQVTDAIGIQNFNRFNFYKHYAPWIAEIQYINPENNAIEFRIKDNESIMENLSTYEFEETDFLEQIQNYIAKVQISHIAFNYVACPKCNHVPEDCKNGFIAYDVQSAFFTMSTMKLRRIT